MKIKTFILIIAVIACCSNAVYSREKMTSFERKLHCNSLANLAFLAAQKVQKGRDLKQIKKEMSKIFKAASDNTNSGLYYELFRNEYETLVKRTYAINPKDAKAFAINYKKSCTSQGN